MIVGFMRNYLNPTYLAQLISMFSNYHGIDLIYFRPKDVNMEKHKIKGKQYINSRWKTVEIDIPLFIDVSPYCFKYKEVMNYLKDRTLLSDDGSNFITKERLQEILKESPDYSHLVIPTEHIDTMDELENYLRKYKKIVLKPVFGEKGKGIYSLTKDDKNNSYLLSYQKQDKNLSHEELINFFNEKIINSGYILQKYISSFTEQGDPFDCRLHVEKNGKGEWTVARNYFRIGFGQKVTSNINQGGGVVEAKQFLKSNFGDKWEEMHSRLNNLAVTLPYFFESVRKQDLMCLGIDVGIDKDGQIYLFEVNSAPGVKSVKAEAALLRSEYYSYILKEKLNKPLINYNEVKSQNEKLKKKINILEHNSNKLKKELKVYQKKYYSMENSKLWRILKPLRKVISIIHRRK